MRAEHKPQPAKTPQRTTQTNDQGKDKDPMRDPTTQVLDAAVKASPPAVVTFYTAILNMPIEKWVGVFTLIYIGLQVFLLIRDRIVRSRRETDEQP